MSREKIHSASLLAALDDYLRFGKSSEWQEQSLSATLERTHETWGKRTDQSRTHVHTLKH
jgi:hypothetical protein